MNVIDDLVQLAKHQPHRVTEALEEAFRRGGGKVPPSSTSAGLARRLRRRAKVVQECDGRSVLLEMAAELEGGAE